MYDDNTGWVCGHTGVLMKTSNGGTNWIANNTGITLNISSVTFANALTGWFTTRITGRIYKSINGGLNWFQQFETNTTIEKVTITDSLYVWAAAFNGKVFRTTNGGLSWDSIIVNSGLNDIDFLNRDTGWACGIGVFKTTNQGNTWVQQLLGVSESESISFIDINTGWLIDLAFYNIYSTTNSGTNWNLIYTLPGCVNAHDIFFTNQNSGWASGDCGTLFSTTNGGLNWFQQLIGTSTFRKALFFNNDSTGWTVGGGGIILKTTTGGAIVPVLNQNNYTINDYNLMQNFPNPFNPETKIKYDIPKLSHVKITIFDILGREIITLVNEVKEPGYYESIFDGTLYSSGVYFYRFESDYFVDSKKMVLIK